MMKTLARGAERITVLPRLVAVALLIALLLPGARAGQSAARLEVGDCVVTLGGEEQLEVRFSRERGLLRAPVRVRVTDPTGVGARSFAFDGFYVVFNGLTQDYRTRSVRTEVARDAAVVTHVLEHASLPAPVSVVIRARADRATGTLRFQVETANGEAVHLDRLGLGDHRGPAVEARRMFLGKALVLDAPIAPFDLKHNYQSTRYWCWTMANGISEMVGSDSIPRGFRFDPANGTYDLHTYCDSSITYTFAWTTRGPQEAMARYRATVDLPTPPTLSQLPGRVTVMTGYPIRERYEDFLDELTGRGVRDFIWLAYAPWPGDRELVEPFGALYSVYDMYTDLFAEGPRKAEGWTPEWVRYEAPGQMKRGYWNSTRCLPDHYIEMAAGKRVQGTLGRELGNRNFLKTEITKFAILAIFKEKVRPSALYLDVHASLRPEHYWDHQGRHHPLAEHLRQERRFFDWTRHYLGDVPVFSEVDTEAFAGIMDAGIFSPWPTPETLGLKETAGVRAAAWEYYPFMDVIHRERLLNSGAGAPYALPAYHAENMALAILFGRPQVISAYPGTPQTDVGGRAQLYYLSSAFHRMLGLARMERVDFEGEDIHRQVASYSNGACIRTNRGTADWEVEGLTLPPHGYLITGPGGFRQYRARQNQLIETVQGPEYQYYFAERRHDFGPVVTGGAIAVRVPEPTRVVVYELIKPGGVELRLGKIPGTRAGQRLVKASILLTRGRKVPLRFPDVTQEHDTLRFRSAEMATAVGYEFELTAPN